MSRLLLGALLAATLTQIPSSAGASTPMLSAETNQPISSTFVLGEPVRITFTATGLAPNTEMRLDVDVRGAFGARVTAGSLAMRADATGKATSVYDAPASRYGYYEVTAKLADGTPLAALGTRPAGIISYAVVTDPAARRDYGDAGSHFGLQGGFSKAAPVLPFLGVRYFLAGNAWNDMEPTAPGQFMADRTKDGLAGKRHPAINISAETLSYKGAAWKTYPVALVARAGLPQWALKPGTGGTSCKSFGALNDVGKQALPSFAAAEAAAFAQDYPGQSRRIYQMTWEPAQGWCFGGTPADIVDLYAHAYGAIHHADPHALIAGPTLFLEPNSTKQLESLWAAGLGRYIDVFSLHPYTAAFPPETHGLPPMLRQQMQEATAAAGHHIGLIGTEHGFQSTVGGNLQKAEGDVRSTIIMLGEGAMIDVGFYVADFWVGKGPAQSQGYGFYWNLNPAINYGTNKLGPKAIVPAYSAMTSMLDGAATRGPLPGLSGTQMGYRFTRDGQTIDVIWDYGTGSSVAVPGGAKVCDWMGNCAPPADGMVILTGAPTYLIYR